MTRLSEEKRNDLEAFWRTHILGWHDSTLNQREYCEKHGLPLKLFGNWRAKFRHEDPRLTSKLLYRRGGSPEHMLKPMRNDGGFPYIPPGRPGDAGRRRNFGTADKQRIVEEACCPGATVSGVAKKYVIGPRLLCQWRKDLTPEQACCFALVHSFDVARPAHPTGQIHGIHLLAFSSLASSDWCGILLRDGQTTRPIPLSNLSLGFTLLRSRRARGECWAR